MEETGGLGVDGIIDLQFGEQEEWNYIKLTKREENPVEQEVTHETHTSESSDAPSSASSASSHAADHPSDLSPLSPSALSSCLTPSSLITFSTLVSCLGVQGRLLTSTPNLQVDPPIARQIFLRGGTLAWIFPQQWIMGATQRGKLARQETHMHTHKRQHDTQAHPNDTKSLMFLSLSSLFVTDIVHDVLSLASRGILPPSIHSRYPLSSMHAGWKSLTTHCSVGKVILFTAAHAIQTITGTSQTGKAHKNANTRHTPVMAPTHHTAMPPNITITGNLTPHSPPPATTNTATNENATLPPVDASELYE